MKVLPPGTILQLMYLKERIKKIKPGFFLEIGPGSGEITHILLNAGWRGISLDLNKHSIYALQKRFKNSIDKKIYEASHDNFLYASIQSKVDLIISSMVIEHFDDHEQHLFFEKSHSLLSSHGMMIAFVPASPKHWGIEDDIAGHYRRYTRPMIEAFATYKPWKLHHLSGLTFPVSNFLLPISNWLVMINEKKKLHLSMQQKTALSGMRHVKFKTQFPLVLGLLLNEITLYPFHILQKIFRHSRLALVFYFELVPNQ